MIRLCSILLKIPLGTNLLLRPEYTLISSVGLKTFSYLLLIFFLYFSRFFLIFSSKIMIIIQCKESVCAQSYSDTLLTGIFFKNFLYSYKETDARKLLSCMTLSFDFFFVSFLRNDFKKLIEKMLIKN